MKKILLVALAAITLASCAKNEVVELNEGNAISFRAWTSNAGRVAPTTTLSIADFTVWAYTATSNKLYMNAVEVTKDGGAWDYTPHQFWPAEELHFYAVSPSTKAGLVAAAADKVQVVDFVQELVAGSQTDLLYAVNKDEARKDTAVQVAFDHALSQISFQALNSNNGAAGIEVVIEGITVAQVNQKGTFTLPIATVTSATDKVATAEQAAWDVTAAQLGNFVAGMAAASQTVGDAAAELTDAAEGRLLLLPQTTTAWDPAVRTSGSYFLVNCTVKDKTSNIYLWAVDATAGGAKQVYIPFAADWAPGKHYIYTFQFGEGAGYDEDGEEVIVPITFDVTVDSFADGAAAGVPAL